MGGALVPSSGRMSAPPQTSSAPHRHAIRSIIDPTLRWRLRARTNFRDRNWDPRSACSTQPATSRPQSGSSASEGPSANWRNWNVSMVQAPEVIKNCGRSTGPKPAGTIPLRWVLLACLGVCNQPDRHSSMPAVLALSFLALFACTAFFVTGQFEVGVLMVEMFIGRRHPPGVGSSLALRASRSPLRQSPGTSPRVSHS
jgi:hypothetical protein